MRLIAKTHTCRVAPGKEFSEPDNIANVLIKLGHADKAHGVKTYETRAMKPKPAPVVTETKDDDGMAELRAEYERVHGKRPFNGWDAETLREKIATYNRRDMRAED